MYIPSKFIIVFITYIGYKYYILFFKLQIRIYKLN
jgi:hypothetical protein